MKKLLIIILIIFPILFFNISFVKADTFKLFSDSLNNTAINSGYENQTVGQDPFVDTIAKVVQMVLGLLGVVFFGLTIYGGYLWMLARGNEEDLKKAQEVLRGAVIGLIIVISAYAVSYYIISKIGAKALIPQ
ncbi:hypothetical protein CO115_01145 [Candidatus Falkowbacteria bacterium CG_4_9_14_3_um_filter_36_9]|uniref:Uncharacterized protein n=2 Tax=Candidatus Falkowiibacteriota TaxID=1752728 RepID=A0A1J4T9I6_9BACT|nr:MAG: hypothetical protein AUJ27_00765 [Candidatus Falkowbacteria bacterium CG1_02_37_44]PIV51925.1 MAG: hypothetical protein COS18_01415 [Candidatus Falkowbacteria bacterium CG02_land_8_20_14_3_00_36_14]PJA11179.1 MAG: hypothetical protein COX67_01130 [Candidatus Falkowbacteria bacterium CG_4_10_14_0_2_um_filter_36_22]PJB20504.1 MAG: hypothetical protein CO115_01145 [Candidatus Falkowbacteria bacterium CG_4_9_14_3_um_filter_36_9]